jgi:hypothetical protein
MDNCFVIDVEYAYQKIKDAKTPKEALEKVATVTESDLFCADRDIREIRLYAYCKWLLENGYRDWVEYIGKLNRFMQTLALGTVDHYLLEDITRSRPEGFIEFRKYIEGRI